MIYFMNRNNILSKEESNKYKSYIYLIGRSEQLCIRYRFLLFQRYSLHELSHLPIFNEL